MTGAETGALNSVEANAANGNPYASQMGANAIDYTPAEFAAMIKREMEKWSKIVMGAGIKPE